MKTSLNGKEFVEKTHPRIELRGKLDELNARIILIQTNSEKKIFIDDLEEVRKIILNLMRSEVTGEECEELFLFGMNESEIHERSHNPEKYYNFSGHVMPHYEMGREAAEINFLRTLVREAEIYACRAFGETRKDFIKNLNRLSSALYILIYKYLPEGYDRIIKFKRNK